MSTIANAGVDMKAMLFSARSGGRGEIRLVVNDLVKAENALNEASHDFKRESAVAIEVPDRIGGLASIIEHSARAGLSAESFFCSVTRLADTALALGVFDDNEAAEKTLRKAGFTVLSQEVIQKDGENTPSDPSLDSYLGGSFFW